MGKDDGQDPPQPEKPLVRDGSTSLLLASSSSSKPPKTAAASRTTKPATTPTDQAVQEITLERRKKITATLESYCRGYAAGVHERVWDPTHPYWSSMSSMFRADPAVGSLPAPETLAEFLDGRRLLSDAHPSYGVKVLDLSTELDEPHGRAECFLSLEVSGVPEGVVRQNLGILEFIREDRLGVEETVRFAGHGEAPRERWWCVRYRSFRGLGGEIMASGPYSSLE